MKTIDIDAWRNVPVKIDGNTVSPKTPLTLRSCDELRMQQTVTLHPAGTTTIDKASMETRRVMPHTEACETLERQLANYRRNHPMPANLIGASGTGGPRWWGKPYDGRVSTLDGRLSPRANVEAVQRGDLRVCVINGEIKLTVRS